MNRTMDIILIIDRSESLSGAPLARIKQHALALIDDLNKCANCKVGLVSFSDVAKMEAALGDAGIDQAIWRLSAVGNTNHAAAFEMALSMLVDEDRERRMILYSDGETTIGDAPTTIAARIRDMGIDIACVGMQGTRGIDERALLSWQGIT